MSKPAVTRQERPQVERLRHAVAKNAVVVSSDPLELLRARASAGGWRSMRAGWRPP
jgi:hypothetical protein